MADSTTPVAMEDVTTVAPVQDTKPKKTFSLDILSTIKNAQAQHGLRHEDYKRYREYCSNRLHRIRKSLNFTHGTSKKFEKKRIDPERVSDVRYIALLLLNAERSWAYAMQLKKEIKTEEDRKRMHYIKKITKAVFWSKKLTELCAARTDIRTRLEAEAYSSFMVSAMKIARNEWNDAIESLIRCRTIYNELSKAGTPNQQELYRQRVEEVDVQIRFAQYNLNKVSPSADSALDLESFINSREKKQASSLGSLRTELDSVLDESRKKQARTINSVYWRGRTVPVLNSKVRTALEKVAAIEADLARDAGATAEVKIAKYTEIINTCNDAAQLIKEDIKASADRQSDQTPNLHLLQAYVSFQSLRKSADKNALLIASLIDRLEQAGVQQGKTKRTTPNEVVRACDHLIQNMTDLEQIPGIDEDDAITNEISSKSATYRVIRCFYLAESYAASDKMGEAYALYNRAEQLIAKDKAASNNAELQKLLPKIRGAKCNARAQAYLQEHAEQNRLTDSVQNLSLGQKQQQQIAPAVTRLDKFVIDKSGKPVITCFPPPQPEPVPCKPFFFDLALNECEFPDLSSKYAAAVTAKPAEQPKAAQPPPPQKQQQQQQQQQQQEQQKQPEEKKKWFGWF